MISNSNRAYSRFIPREEIEAQAHIITQWDFGLVGSAEGGGPVVAPVSIVQPVDNVVLPPEPEVVATVIEEAQHLALLEQTREQAHAQGYAKGHADGHADGYADGYAEGDAKADAKLQEDRAVLRSEAEDRLGRLAQNFENRLSELQQGMAKELLHLACDIARQVVRRELSNNPKALLPVVREALDMFVKEGRVATVRLHPDNWVHLEAPLREGFKNAKVQWQVDSGVAAGDCLVESAGNVVDARLEKRWQRAVAALGLVPVPPWEESNDGN